MDEQLARVAVIIPCFNEAAAIGKVVRDFKRALPDASIFVYDNNSMDETVAAAREAGAIVRNERLQGKGNVVRRMFADVDADVYVMVDGDATYDAPSASTMVRLLLDEQLDMVVGCRVESQSAAYRTGHRFGNALLTGFVASLFGNRFTDILSGYRAFSSRFVKSFPGLAAGFEVETELTVHALELGMPVGEVKTPYHVRAEGTASKLKTYRDGWKILLLITWLYKNEKPLQFFTIVAAFLAAVSVAMVIPIIETYLHTGLVPRLPTAVLATGVMLLAFLSLASGLILDTVTRGRKEVRRLTYLSFKAPADEIAGKRIHALPSAPSSAQPGSPASRPL
jgi:glycosyltransferase involved in cell wall biosynthesis